MFPGLEDPAVEIEGLRIAGPHLLQDANSLIGLIIVIAIVLYGLRPDEAGGPPAAAPSAARRTRDLDGSFRAYGRRIEQPVLRVAAPRADRGVAVPISSAAIAVLRGFAAAVLVVAIALRRALAPAPRDRRRLARPSVLPVRARRPRVPKTTPRTFPAPRAGAAIQERRSPLRWGIGEGLRRRWRERRRGRRRGCRGSCRGRLAPPTIDRGIVGAAAHGRDIPLPGSARCRRLRRLRAGRDRGAGGCVRRAHLDRRRGARRARIPPHDRRAPARRCGLAPRGRVACSLRAPFSARGAFWAHALGARCLGARCLIGTEAVAPRSRLGRRSRAAIATRLAAAVASCIAIPIAAPVAAPVALAAAIAIVTGFALRRSIPVAVRG